jgi:hypothetical protein
LKVNGLIKQKKEKQMAIDFSKLTREEILKIDPDTLSPEDIAAGKKRLKELEIDFSNLTEEQLANIRTDTLSPAEKKAKLKRLKELYPEEAARLQREREAERRREEEEKLQEIEEDKSFSEKAGDLAVSTGKALTHGAALAPAYVADLVPLAGNLSSWLLEKIYNKTVQPETPLHIPSIPFASETLKEKVLDKYMPLSDKEKIAREAFAFINPAAKISMAKNAINKAPTVLKYLLSAPEGKKAVASAGLGGATFEAARQFNPEDPFAPILKSLVAQHILSAPAAIKGGAKGIANYVSDIKAPKQLVESVDIDPKAVKLMETIGEEPNVGLTSKSPHIRGLYQQVKNEPGSKIAQREEGLFNKLNKDTLEAIEPEEFLKDRVNLAEETKKTAKNISEQKNIIMKELEALTNKYLPEEEIIKLPNTVEAIKKFKGELELPNLSGVLGDKKIPREARVLEALEKGEASYKDAKFALREVLNKKVSNFLTEGKVDEGRIKKLADAINKDIEFNFASKGPEAIEARAEFNKYYKNYKDYIQPISNKIKKQIGGEAVSILNKELFNKDSANKYLPLAFKNSDNPEQLAKGLLYQAGLKNNNFNASHFYKALDKIPEKNYKQIMSILPKEQKVIIENMKSLNDHLSMIQTYKNFPNTAQHLKTTLKTATRIIVAGYGGVEHGPLGALGGFGGSELLLRAAAKANEGILTSPAFYNWINKVDKAPNKKIAMQINKNYGEKLKHLYPHANRFIIEMEKYINSDINNDED